MPLPHWAITRPPVAQFNALLDTHPDYYRAYARRWATLLARDRDARTRRLIEAEIGALATRQSWGTLKRCSRPTRVMRCCVLPSIAGR